MPNLWELFIFFSALTLLAVAVEAITEILVTSALLDIIGLRRWAVKKAMPTDPADLDGVRWYHTALHKLLTCGYCCSVWVAGAFAWLLPGDYLGLLPWDNIVIKIFLLHRLSNWVHVAESACGLVRRLAKKKHDHHVVQTLGHGEQDDRIVVRLEIDDAREAVRGVRAAGEEAGRQDLHAADGEQPQRPEGGAQGVGPGDGNSPEHPDQY